MRAEPFFAVKDPDTGRSGAVSGSVSVLQRVYCQDLDISPKEKTFMVFFVRL